MSQYFPYPLSAYPQAAAYVAAIPPSIIQGDSAEWVDVAFTDVNGVEYDAGSYTLKYTLAGPTTPLVLTATSSGSSWQTNLTTAQSAALAAGKYWWTAQVFGTGVRLTLASGEFTVQADLALQGAGYDQRTLAEKALADAEAALAIFRSSGGRLQAFTIGTRHTVFQRDSDLLAIVVYWRNRVNYERMKANGGTARMILSSFRSAR